jgi:serine phosphatase RsbU (regulator of sigma subunit)
LRANTVGAPAPALDTDGAAERIGPRCRAVAVFFGCVVSFRRENGRRCTDHTDCVVKSLFKAAAEHSGGEEAFDDETVVAIRVKGVPKRK